MIVLSWSKATRDLLKSFSWGIGALRQLFAGDDGAISFAACPIPSLPGIIAGMILSFARSMGEFGATITFVANIPGETQTLPSAIYTLTQIPGGDAGALRLTLISIAISMLALLAAEFLARRLSRILPGS